MITNSVTLTHRVTELPPSVAHLKMSSCHVEGLVLPAGRQLRSLHLEHCNPRPKGTAPGASDALRVPINLLDWLESTQPGATVQMSHVVLTLGSLSMEQTAKRLSELATCSISIMHCPLRGHDPAGCFTTHGVANVFRYVEQHFGRRVTVTCDWGDNLCTIVRLGRVL